MFAKLIDVFSNSKIGTVATFERAQGVRVGDKLHGNGHAWTITEVAGANPREPEWVGVVIDISARDHLIPLLGQQIEITSADA